MVVEFGFGKDLWLEYSPLCSSSILKQGDFGFPRAFWFHLCTRNQQVEITDFSGVFSSMSSILIRLLLNLPFPQLAKLWKVKISLYLSSRLYCGRQISILFCCAFGSRKAYGCSKESETIKWCFGSIPLNWLKFILRFSSFYFVHEIYLLFPATIYANLRVTVQMNHP